MRITADTNLLLRVAVGDDPQQSGAASASLRAAELIAVPTLALCEFVWVLRRTYEFEASEIISAVRELLNIASVRVDRASVEAGLAALEAGGDFADACIAFEGRRMGGTIFTSFDRKAVALVKAAGGEAHLLNISGQSQ